VGEGCVDDRRYGVLCGSVLHVCILVRVYSDVDAVLDVSHDQSLEALHDYRGEDYWPSFRLVTVDVLGMGIIVAVYRQVGTPLVGDRF